MPIEPVYHPLAAGLVLVNNGSGLRATVVDRSPRHGATSWVLRLSNGTRIVRTQIELFTQWREPKKS